MDGLPDPGPRHGGGAITAINHEAVRTWSSWTSIYPIRRGFSVLETMRKTCQVPVIMLTRPVLRP